MFDSLFRTIRLDNTGNKPLGYHHLVNFRLFAPLNKLAVGNFVMLHSPNTINKSQHQDQ